MASQPPPIRSKSTGGVAGSHPVTSRFPIFAGPSTAKQLNTVVSAVIPIACWRVDDVRFAFDSSFVQPQVAEEIGALIALREEHKFQPPSANPAAAPAIFPPVSLFGHADPTGDDEYNKQLSGRRATAIYGLLTRDTALWEQLYSNPLGHDNWGTRAIQVMLDELGFDPGPADGKLGPNSEAAIRQFQSSAGLPPSGNPSAATRAKLFLAYMNQICGEDFHLDKSSDFLAGTEASGKGDYQGCGEFNPLLLFSQTEQDDFAKAENKATRDEQNAPNRRVMLLLFQPGTRITAQRWPCPTVKEGPAGCRKRFWSDGEQRRNTHLPDERREFRKTADTFACRFYHRLASESPCEQLLALTGSHISVLLRSNSGAVPLRRLDYRITLDDGRVLQGKTDDEGLIEHDNIAPGDYALELSGNQTKAQVPTLPKHLERRTLRVPDFFLFEEQAPGNLLAIDSNEDYRAEGGGKSTEITV